MANVERISRTLLTRRLTEEARHFSFEQVQDLLSYLGDERTDDDIGFGPVLYRANPSLSFPSSDIDSITLTGTGYYEVVVNFLGLYGPASPLPVYYTESIIQEFVRHAQGEGECFYLCSKKDCKAFAVHQFDIAAALSRAGQLKEAVNAGTKKIRKLTSLELETLFAKEPLESILSPSELELLGEEKLILEVYQPPRSNERDFFDLFNHQSVSLYGQVSKKYRPIERHTKRPPVGFEDMLYSFIGAPEKQHREASPIHWPLLLKHSGLLAINRGSPEVIVKVVSGYLGLPWHDVWVEEAISRDAHIPRFQQFQLGYQANQLGKAIVLGEVIEDVEHKFRLHLCELDTETFLSFLPIEQNPQNRYQELIALLNYLTAHDQLFDICLHLHDECELPWQLGEQPHYLLGYSCWLGEPGRGNYTTLVD
ncbi:type VI secretion system baseplate subunit TssG [Aestuariibacter salexigens]|uniref:type VI secretion system baseplate subunit TssG n=1 Tax=Aestuariibacter salexigens TaxID=226010 RepID=UPI000414C1F6|nr:type VI secretion system baseplate subunit TssG [Aestuariibacter salexigens]